MNNDLPLTVFCFVSFWVVIFSGKTCDFYKFFVQTNLFLLNENERSKHLPFIFSTLPLKIEIIKGKFHVLKNSCDQQTAA